MVDSPRPYGVASLVAALDIDIPFTPDGASTTTRARGDLRLTVILSSVPMRMFENWRFLP